MNNNRYRNTRTSEERQYNEFLQHIREEKEDFRKQPVIVGTLKNILKVPNNRAPKKYKQITNVEHASPDSGKLEEPKS